MPKTYMAPSKTVEFQWPTPYIFGTALCWFNVEAEIDAETIVDSEQREYFTQLTMQIRAGQRVVHNSTIKYKATKTGDMGHLLKQTLNSLTVYSYEELRPYVLAGGGARNIQFYSIGYLIYNYAEFVQWVNRGKTPWVGAKWKKKYNPNTIPVGFYVESGIFLKDTASGGHYHVALVDIARKRGDVEISDEQYAELRWGRSSKGYYAGRS